MVHFNIWIEEERFAELIHWHGARTIENGRAIWTATRDLINAIDPTNRVRMHRVNTGGAVMPTQQISLRLHLNPGASKLHVWMKQGEFAAFVHRFGRNISLARGHQVWEATHDLIRVLDAYGDREERGIRTNRMGEDELKIGIQTL